jgi:hypothetical protein
MHITGAAAWQSSDIAGGEVGEQRVFARPAADEPKYQPQAPALRRNVISVALGLPPVEVEANLRRVLHQHEAERNAFFETLAPNSFVHNGSLEVA